MTAPTLERLSEEELAALCTDSVPRWRHVERAVDEVRAHRAAALSEADRELLLALRDIGRAVNQDEVSEAWSRHSGDKVERAIAVLDRLLGRSAT